MKTTESQILEHIRRSGSSTFSVQALARALHVSRHDLRPFRRLVIRLQNEGKIPRNRASKRSAAGDRITGRVQGTRRHFAFILVEDGQDLYVRPENLDSAIHGDLVRARVERYRGRLEGIVEEVVERQRRVLAGTLECTANAWYLIPDEPRIIRDIFLHASEVQPHRKQRGHKALVTITGAHKGELHGNIVTILGAVDKPGVRTRALMAEFSLPEEFPPPVLSAVASIQPPQAADFENREDLSGALAFTIDPENAKDHDDAVSVRPLEDNTFEVGVHIADVAHYVAAGSVVDVEADRRSTSVYLTDRVIPMLPELLSNHVCSLQPGVPRLTLSVLMQLNGEGELLGWRLSRTWIVSRAKLSYRAADKLARGEAPPEGEYSLFQGSDREASFVPEHDWEALRPMLTQSLGLVRRLTRKVRERRFAHGALEIETPEYEVRHDRRGRVIDINEKKNRESHQWIEELMLLANQAVARSLAELKLPLLWRTHAAPDFQKFEQLRLFLKQVGIGWSPQDKPTNRDYRQVIRSIRNKPECKYLMVRILRSLQKARYDASSGPHFGLAFSFYTHFTSPIRRFPDLHVHRLVHHLLDVQQNQASKLPAIALKPLAHHCTQREILATEAERASFQLKVCEFLGDRLGEQTAGYVSSIHEFGIYIDLPEWKAEGMIPLQSLTDDEYTPDMHRTVLKGAHSGRSFRFGQRLHVQLVRVDPDRRQIDLCLVS